MASYRASGSRMNKVPMLSLLLALILGSGPQDVLAKGHHPKVDQRWFFGTALNYNLPTGQLYFPPTFNPVFSSTTTLVGGGFSYTPSFSYALRIGYDRSFTKNGVHGFTAGLGFTDRKRILQFKDYTLFYNGMQYKQYTDRFVFDDLDLELHFAYRFRMNRTTAQLGAMGLVRTQYIMHDYQLDGDHYEVKSNHWYKLSRWYPAVQINYQFLAKGKFRMDMFVGGNRRMFPDKSDTAWLDIQVGVQVSLVKQMKRRRWLIT